MTPLQFEQLYRSDWDELSTLLAGLLGRGKSALKQSPPRQAERVVVLYRRVCEHLALARARAYPAHLLEPLEHLTADAHQVIYQRREFGLLKIKHFVTVDFPRSVRAHAGYVWLAAAVFYIPMLILGWLVYLKPDLILSMVDPWVASQMQGMYSDSAQSLGRSAGTDWGTFGYYIWNNIGIAFQCFASGLFAGVGSLFYLIFNGAFIGAIGGYLTAKGLGHNFYPFVVTHSAFELTAIVLSGAAGLRVGHAWLSPGRLSRIDSLVNAARGCSTLITGTALMLVVAAAIEAFWSSSVWLPHVVKFSVAGACWVAVLSYLALQGRHAD